MVPPSFCLALGPRGSGGRPSRLLARLDESGTGALGIPCSRRVVPSGEEAVCAICQMEYEDGETLMLLTCSHTFHEACVGRWFEQKSTCPVCQHDLRQSLRR